MEKLLNSSVFYYLNKLGFSSIADNFMKSTNLTPAPSSPDLKEIFETSLTSLGSASKRRANRSSSFSRKRKRSLLSFSNSEELPNGEVLQNGFIVSDLVNSEVQSSPVKNQHKLSEDEPPKLVPKQKVSPLVPVTLDVKQGSESSSSEHSSVKQNSLHQNASVSVKNKSQNTKDSSDSSSSEDENTLVTKPVEMESKMDVDFSSDDETSSLDDEQEANKMSFEKFPKNFQNSLQQNESDSESSDESEDEELSPKKGVKAADAEENDVDSDSNLEEDSADDVKNDSEDENGNFKRNSLGNRGGFKGRGGFRGRGDNDREFGGRFNRGRGGRGFGRGRGDRGGFNRGGRGGFDRGGRGGFDRGGRRGRGGFDRGGRGGFDRGGRGGFNRGGRGGFDRGGRGGFDRGGRRGRGGFDRGGRGGFGDRTSFGENQQNKKIKFDD